MIVVDTSGVLALLDADDPDHERCVQALSLGGAPFVVPAGILGEAGYLIEAKLGTRALAGFVDELQSRAFALDCGEDDFAVIASLLERYADLRLGLADAAVVACAERRGAPVLTLDFRDFAPIAREGRIALSLPG
jgi:predicted nucleic acid-binding protein